MVILNSIYPTFIVILTYPNIRPWTMQTFDIWYIFVGQILLGLHQSNWKNAYWKISYFLKTSLTNYFFTSKYARDAAIRKEKVSS